MLRALRAGVYAGGACAGNPLVEATAGAGAWTSTQTIPRDAATSFSARAVDAAGNASVPCASVTFYQDGTPPAAPTIATSPATSPAAPSGNNNPSVVGTAEAGATVRLYSGASCQGQIVAAATATSGAYSFGVTVANDTTAVYSTTATDVAGNVSACSGGVSYYEDSTGPTVPTIGTTPATQANAPSNQSTNVAISGTTSADAAKVRLFAGGVCGGAPLGELAVSSATYSFTRDVPQNQNTQFSVRALDAAQNASPCAAVTYYEDSAPPAVPTIVSTTPAAQSQGTRTSNRTPSMTVRVAGAGENRIRLYANGSCAGAYQEVATTLDTTTFAAGGDATAVSDGLTLYSALALDSAGNASGRSAAVPYYTDNTKPVVSIFSTPPPVSGNYASFGSSVDETGVTIECLWDGVLVGGSCWSQGDLSPGRHTFQERATDVAGNASDWTPATPFSWTVRSGAGHVALVGNDLSNSSPFDTVVVNAVALARAKLTNGRSPNILLYEGTATATERAPSRTASPSGSSGRRSCATSCSTAAC